MSAADAMYELVRRFVRDPWPLDGPDTLFGAPVVREAGFSIAGPKVREGQMFGILLAVAGIGGLILPGARRTLHGIHVAEQRVGQQRMRIYGAAQRALADRSHVGDTVSGRRGVRSYAP